MAQEQFLLIDEQVLLMEETWELGLPDLVEILTFLYQQALQRDQVLSDLQVQGTFVVQTGYQKAGMMEQMLVFGSSLFYFYL